ncbi:hypothetical protein E4U55_004628 [Claviceps digitariae]|nr:hypothetical protein E4U55_004628 [Claviceps digitariae]
MATVIRTPHRQSLVDFAETGTSAWELFVNGISFDTSEDTEQLQDNEWSNLDAQESLDKAHKMGEVPQVKIETIPNHMVAPATAGSFLGTRPEKKYDPGGKVMQLGVLSNTKSRTAKEKMFQQDDPKKCVRDARDSGTRNLHCRTPSMGHRNMKLLQRSLLPNVIDKSGVRTRENIPKITKGRRKVIMPNWGHWIERGTTHFAQISKASSPRTLNRSATMSRRQQEEHSALKFELDPNPPNSGRNELEPILAQHAAPGRLILTRGMNIKFPSVDQEPKQRNQTRIPASGAMDIQDEMTQNRESNQTNVAEDMTMKNRGQTVTECASTHIITTIGCDRIRSETSFPTKSEQKTNNNSSSSSNNRRAQPGDFQKGGAAYNPPPIATFESNLGSSVMRILQKPSSRVKLAKVGDEIGITSKCNPRQGERHTNKNTKPFLDIDCAVVSKIDAPATIAPRIQDVSGVQRTPKQRGDMPVGQLQPNPAEEIDDVSNKRVEKPVQAAAVTVVHGAMNIYDADMFVQDELTALVQAPGRFPDSSIGGQVTRDGQNSPGDCAGARDAGTVVQAEDGLSGSLLERAGESVWVVWCYMLPLWQVYWERVGPLFDLKSEYWARQNRDEGTMGDCLTVVLAIPTSLLFIASYVVALRLGLLCIENCNIVREWAENVYWYVMVE